MGSPATTANTCLAPEVSMMCETKRESARNPCYLYLVMALCCLTLPFGAVGLVCACRAHFRFAAGHKQGAESMTKWALISCFTAVLAASISLIMVILLSQCCSVHLYSDAGQPNISGETSVTTKTKHTSKGTSQHDGPKILKKIVGGNTLGSKHSGGFKTNITSGGVSDVFRG